MKKFLSVLLVMVLAVMSCGALTSCSAGQSASQSTSQSASQTTSQTTSQSQEKTKIGVIMYGYTDDQGKNIKEYCSYLEKNFNVQFVYEATNYNDDAQISCVENLISAGCKAIISGYDTSLESSIQTCDAAGVYYVLALDYASPADAKNVNSKYFLGGTKQFGGDEAAVGKAYAKAFLASGLKNVTGVSFPAFAFVEAPAIYTAFKSEIQAAGQYTVGDLAFASGFTQENVQAAATSAITADTQAIFGMSSGLDYVYPVLKNNHPNVKLLALGYNISVSSLLQSGALIASGNNNHPQSIASCFVRVMNALGGKAYSDAASGTYNQKKDSVNIVNGVASYPVFSTAAGLADYQTYVLGQGSDGMEKGAVTAAEIKKVLLSENKDATLADLNKLTARTVDEIKAARSK